MGGRAYIPAQTKIPIRAGRIEALAGGGLFEGRNQRDNRLHDARGRSCFSRQCSNDIEGAVRPDHVVVQNRERGLPASAVDRASKASPSSAVAIGAANGR